MKTQFSQELGRVVRQYGLYLLETKIKGNGSLGSETFYEFVSNSYSGFYKTLQQLSQEQDITISVLIYGHLLEKQKRIYGPLFQASEEQEHELNECLEKIVSSSKEVQEFRTQLQPYLNQEQNQRFIEKLAELLYEKLDEGLKKEISLRRLKKYILNLGFIRLPRVSHKQALDFIVKYIPLFGSEEEVLNAIIGRYIDEELAITPIEQTKQRIGELKREVRNLYVGVKEK